MLCTVGLPTQNLWVGTPYRLDLVPGPGLELIQRHAVPPLQLHHRRDLLTPGLVLHTDYRHICQRSKDTDQRYNNVLLFSALYPHFCLLHFKDDFLSILKDNKDNDIHLNQETKTWLFGILLKYHTI